MKEQVDCFGSVFLPFLIWWKRPAIYKKWNWYKIKCYNISDSVVWCFASLNICIGYFYLSHCETNLNITDSKLSHKSCQSRLHIHINKYTLYITLQCEISSHTVLSHLTYQFCCMHKHVFFPLVYNGWLDKFNIQLRFLRSSAPFIIFNKVCHSYFPWGNPVSYICLIFHSEH